MRQIYKNTFNRNQLLALSTVVLLVPALRLVPSLTASLGGRAAWLSAPAAALPLTAYIYLLCRIMSRRKSGEGMGEMMLRTLGGTAGGAMLIFYAAGILLYAGFILRAGAERMVTMIYPDSSPVVFSVLTGIVAVVAALGSPRSLMRFAKLVQPVVIGTLGLFLLFALTSLDFKNLFPVAPRDVPGAALSALPVIGAVGSVSFFVCFFESECAYKPKRFGDFALWLVPTLLLFFILSIAVLGRFGAELTASLTFPFFTLVRNLVFFNTLERLEALIVSLWLFPDFLFVAALLYCAQYCLRLAAGEKPAFNGEKRFDMARGRWLIPVCGALSITAAILIAPDISSMTLWSERIIPALNLSVSLLFAVIIYVAGRVRKRI